MTKTYVLLHEAFCGGGRMVVELESLIVVEGGGGGTICVPGYVVGISCAGGTIVMGGRLFVFSIPCVGGTGNGTGCDSIVGWLPNVNLGWINDDEDWLLAGFNGVNADGGDWNALGIDGGRIEDWINGDEKCELDVCGCRSGFNVGILLGLCWNSNGEPVDGIWVALLGAGKSGLKGVLTELANGA